jgi:hypothetical protein
MVKSATAILLAVILTAVGSSASGAVKAKTKAPWWIATGSITALTGPTVSVLMKDGRTYHVDANKADVVVGNQTGNYLALRVNDIVRVMGNKADGKIVASWLVVLPPTQFNPPAVASATPPAKQKPKGEIDVYGEEIPPPMIETPEESPYLPPPMPVRPPKPPAPPISTTFRGLATDILYDNQSMTVQTSRGSMVVDLAPASFTYAGRATGIGRLDKGDVVEVAGELGGNRTLTAAEVTILMKATTAQAATTVQHLSIYGYIASIDYPSNTLVVQGLPGKFVIAADDSTTIGNGYRTFNFVDLGPTTRVKVRAYGNPSTGFVADDIFVVGQPSSYVAGSP